MKQILTILLLLVFITSYSKTTVYDDGKEAVKTVYGDAKKIAPKIESAVQEIAKGMKVGAENIWDILVRQQLVWSLCFLILTISSLINWWMFYRRMYPNQSKIEYNVLERDIIGDVVNPNYNEYRLGDSPTIKGPVGKEQYNAPILPIDSNSTKIFHWLHFVICMTLSYFSFVHFSDMLTGFINPEFGAMKTILDFSTTILK